MTRGRPRSCWIAGDANQPRDRQEFRLVVSHDQQDAEKNITDNRSTARCNGEVDIADGKFAFFAGGDAALGEGFWGESRREHKGKKSSKGSVVGLSLRVQVEEAPRLAQTGRIGQDRNEQGQKGARHSTALFQFAQLPGVGTLRTGDTTGHQRSDQAPFPSDLFSQK